MPTALSERRVLSRPCRVHFAGWETTTNRLQQAGWSLSAEQGYDRGTVRLAAWLKPIGLYMLSECQNYNFYRCDALPVFEVRAVTSDMSIRVDAETFAFSPIDARAQFVSIEHKRIEDFGIFATPLTRTEEIIVEPATVVDLMNKIRALQAPELAEIRRRNHVREHAEAAPRQQFHAQILSLAA